MKQLLLALLLLISHNLLGQIDGNYKTSGNNFWVIPQNGATVGQSIVYNASGWGPGTISGLPAGVTNGTTYYNGTSWVTNSGANGLFTNGTKVTIGDPGYMPNAFNMVVSGNQGMTVLGITDGNIVFNLIPQLGGAVFNNETGTGFFFRNASVDKMAAVTTGVNMYGLVEITNSSIGGVTYGTPGLNQSDFKVNNAYNVPSGTVTQTSINITSAYTLTGVTGGQLIGININPNFINRNDVAYTGINIPYTSGGSFGIKQTSTNIINALAGKTAFGGSAIPAESIDLQSGTLKFAVASGIMANGSTGTSGHVLTANGTGGLSWTAPSGSSGITTLNTLTAATQTFAVGTAGTDFAINSSTSTHTFNIPTASVSNRGALSTTDWSAFNAKVANNGNSFAAGMTIGTNDNNVLNLETNDVSRLTISSGTTAGGEATFTNVSTATIAPANGLTLIANSNGTAGTGFGNRLLFQLESSTTNARDAVGLSAIWTDGTDASRTSALVYSDVTGAGAITERFRFTPTAMIMNGVYTIGNSSNAITLGGASGTVNIGNSSGPITAVTTSSSGIQLHVNNMAGSVKFGTGAFTTAGSLKRVTVFDDSYTVASGVGGLTAISIENVINLTSTASGVSTGIDINPTLTGLALGSYRGINIPYNGLSAFGVYQTGANTRNVLEGPTRLGAIELTFSIVGVSNSRYVTNQTTQIAVTLPSVSQVGDIIEISGKGTGGWKIAQNAGQVIHATTDTTVGATGFIASQARYDCVLLKCIIANTDWVIQSVKGTLSTN